jgi:hypothetical protein
VTFDWYSIIDILVAAVKGIATFYAFIVFLLLNFIDDFPISLFTYGSMGGTAFAAYELFVRRLGRILDIVKKVLGHGKASLLSEEKEDFKVFSIFGVQLMALSILAAVTFDFSFYPYIRLFQNGQEVVERFTLSEFGAHLLQTINCAFWHSWKGIPESMLGWLDFIFSVRFGKVSGFLSYNCNEWYSRYSTAVSFLVLPVLPMGLLLGLKIIWHSVRR